MRRWPLRKYDACTSIRPMTNNTCDSHAWTWTYDEGPHQHCDDCGADHPENPPHPDSNGSEATNVDPASYAMGAFSYDD